MVEIIENFLTEKEYKIAEEAILKIQWHRGLKRKEINLPFLKKLCKSNEDYFSYVTLMDEKDVCFMKWHKDIHDQEIGMKLKPGQKWIGEATQWIIYMGGNFTGGLLHTRDQIIKPIPNRLVLLNPFREEHKVESVKGKRYSIGGFIYSYDKI